LPGSLAGAHRAIIFGDLIGKLGVLLIECGTAGRASRYHFHTAQWYRVCDHFGDQNVPWMFASAASFMA